MKPGTIVTTITGVSLTPGNRDRISTHAEPAASTPLQATDDMPCPHPSSSTGEVPSSCESDAIGTAITPIP